MKNIFRSNEELTARERRIRNIYVPAGALAVGLIVAYGAVKGVNMYQDKTTTDSTAIEMLATTYPNPSEGAAETISKALASTDHNVVEAAKHIDKSDLAQKMAEEVHQRTGQSDRQLSGVKTLIFKAEKDGDISEVTLVDDTANPDYKAPAEAEAFSDVAIGKALKIGEE